MTTDTSNPGNTTTYVALHCLTQRSNYREEYDQDFVNKLASDMSTNGFKAEYPVVTYLESATGQYIVIDGNTRYTAARQASAYRISDHNPTLMVWIVVKPKPTDKEFILGQLSANELRRDPDSLSQARGYQTAIDAGSTIQEIANETGHTADYIQRRLWLLDLVPEAQKLVANGNLGIKYGEAMHTLDTNFQRIALQAYNKREVKTIDEFSALCSQLLEKQNTCSLFDLALFNGKPIESVVDMSKVKTDKLSPDTVIKALEAELARERQAKQELRDKATADYTKLLRQYRALLAQTSGPLFASIGV